MPFVTKPPLHAIPTMKQNTRRSLFTVGFTSLFAAVAAHGAIVTIVFRVPLPVAANGFKFRQYGPNSSIVETDMTYAGIVTPHTSGGSPVYDDDAYLDLRAQVDLATGDWFWLHDVFEDRDIQYETLPAGTPPPVVVSLSFPNYAKYFFAADATRLADDFTLLLDGTDRVLVPVTKRPQVQLPITTGGVTVLTTFPFFTAYGDPSQIWNPASMNAYLLDVTETQAAGANVRAVAASGWVPLSGSIATRSVTFLFDEAEAANGFTIHSGTSLTGVNPPLSPGNIESPVFPYYFYDVRFAGATVGTLDTVWVTRNADLVSSPHMKGQGPVVDLRGAFQALPPWEMHLQRFRLREDTRGGHILTILHGDGRSEPLTWKSAPDTLTQTTNGSVSTSVSFFWAEREFDNTRAWSLVDESTNPHAILFSTGPGYFQQVEKRSRPVDVLDGWEPPHLAPAAGQRRVTLPASRRTHGLSFLTSASGTGAPLVLAFSSTPAANDSTATYDGPWDVSVAVSAFELIGAAGSNAAGTLQDTTTGEALSLPAGTYSDLTMWRPPAPALSLRIADTRWPDALILRQADGSEYSVAAGTVQGVWVPTLGAASGSTFYSYGYFDATTRYDSGNDWWAVDLTAVLSGSLSAASPHQTTDLHAWGASNQDSDGDNLSNYDEFVRGTLIFNPDTDGDGYYDSVDAFPLDARYHWTDGNDVNGAPTIVLTGPPGATLTP